MWEIIIVCTVFGAFIMTSFIVGLYYGSKISKGERIELPEINPVKIVKNNLQENVIEKQNNHMAEINEINAYNIDNYDGTGFGQKDFPTGGE